MSTECHEKVIFDRIMARVEKTEGGCWKWKGASNPLGYGKIGVRMPSPKTYATHVFVYRHIVGSVPDGMELDHTCRNPGCCNPDHLEPVTHKENVLRGNCVASAVRRTGQCKRGHEMSNENVYVFPDGRRQCRECRKVARESSRARRNAHAVFVANGRVAP